MTEILDPWIASINDADISVPCLSPSESLNVLIPAPFNASYRWSVKLLRVSKPLKLKNTSYTQLLLFRAFGEKGEKGEKEEEEEENEAIWG